MEVHLTPELEAKLSKVKKEITGSGDADAQREREITAYVGRVMGYHASIKKAQQQAEQDYKDDPDGLEKVTMALEQLRESKMQP